MNTKTIFTICLLLFGAMAVQAQGKSDLNKGAKAFKTKNYTEAFEWYKKAAEKGNADAMNRIGVLYSGYLEPQDKEEAFKWFLKAAEGGNLNGITHVAGAYDRGSGVAQNPEEALKWYRIAADKGDHHSKYKVKEITTTLVADAKKQTDKSNTTATTTSTTPPQANTAPTKPNNPISSPQANTVSTTNTAIKTTSSITSATDNGSGDYAKGAQAYTQKNFTEAFKWFKIAADKGNVKAAAILGAMCYNGEGVSKNETEGFKWYKLAAEGDYLEAKHNVGLFYAAGKGVQANYHEARKWLKEAAKEGYSKSPEILWELDKNIFALMLMSPSQLHDWEGSNGKLGYKDKASGSVWIPAKYEDGGLISEVEQLAPAKLNGKWGFIDLYDKTVIPFQYEDAEPLSFIEGLAAVKQNGKWGFIDKSGKTIIPFQYDKVELGCFVNGYAKVIQNGKTLFIHNPLDKVSTTTKSTAAATTQTKPSSNSNASLAQLPLTPFKGTNGKYGYKDQSGKVIVEPIYDFAYDFSEGLAAVNVGGHPLTGGGLWGFVDTTGKEIIPVKYEAGIRFPQFAEGLVALKLNGKYGFVDKTGKEVIPFQYELAESFKDGKAKVFLTKGGLPFYIDKTGTQID